MSSSNSRKFSATFALNITFFSFSLFSPPKITAIRLLDDFHFIPHVSASCSYFLLLYLSGLHTILFSQVELLFIKSLLSYTLTQPWVFCFLILETVSFILRRSVCPLQMCLDFLEECLSLFRFSILLLHV